MLDGLRRDRCGAGTRGGLVGVEGVDGLLGDGHGALCAGRSLGGLVGASLLGGAGRYVQGGVGRGAWSGRWGRVVLITGCSLGWRRALGAETGMRWDSPALLVRGLHMYYEGKWPTCTATCKAPTSFPSFEASAVLQRQD